MTHNTADQQDAEAQQYIAFKRWLRQPGGLPAQPLTSDAAGMFAYIEDALWVAWQAGWRHGQSDANNTKLGVASRTIA